MRKSNYDKQPSTHIEGSMTLGWDNIISTLSQAWADEPIWAIDLYPGTYEEDFMAAFAKTGRKIIDTRTLMRPEEEIRQLTERFMTDDVLFGYMSNIRLEEYFPNPKPEIKEPSIVIGTAAAWLAPNAPVCYADMARWEIQQRFRRHEVKALGIDNHQDSPSVQYKRGYFNDWNIIDHYKDNLMQSSRIQFWIDSNQRNQPKMITDAQMRQGLQRTAHSPFRVVPFFDPAPWGGQWMKEVCDLPREEQNYGWCFDCVPEENSLYLEADGTLFELPSQDVVLSHTRELLGQQVWHRFGKSFPIRFDFLDTMQGGNLSLQVHPTNEFAQREFGLPYTQDESYYLLDAAPDAVVYLGLKEGIDKVQMIEDLRAAQRGDIIFDAEKYVNKLPAKKHDHYLIPAGTIHCSGHNSMVLEISSTPSIFTFKLWDWARLGLDGKPRPINVERGKHVIQWERTTPFVKTEIANHFEVLHEEEGIKEERTGLHPNEFIETRRHTFSRPVEHNTNGGVNVLNLVDGTAAIIESPEGKFKPFEVHYAETFIIPACIGRYTITPLQGECMTLKASIRPIDL
ncbi:MAG: class I mannose-6-phosphate isomerase [Bacteroidaceae bacterium]|nr:class I mannose-6-phosphate isomerase [Bacteroidaceae bacterium]MBQ5622323.1 class I mannose-6-phosphate isomerase [Bacteroidaceae bacterium]